MSTATGEGHLPQERVSSANARFKARRSARLAWSTLMAVAVHVAMFAFGPNWEAVPFPSPHVSLAPGLGSGVPYADTPGLSGVRLATLSDLEGPVPSESRPGVEELAGVADAAEPRPASEAEPEPGAPPPAPQSIASDDGLAQIATTVSTRDMPSTQDSPRSAGLSSPEFARLTDLRPQLALFAPEVWVLVRNPTEVEAFLRRSYRRGTLDPSATGSVSVTLWVDERGSVEWAEISKSSGRPELDEFALALFNEVVVFRAAREQGVSVSRSVTFSVDFPW